MNEYRRVVVTGLGVVSPVGSDMETCWNNLASGYNGIGPITYFDTENYNRYKKEKLKCCRVETSQGLGNPFS